MKKYLLTLLIPFLAFAFTGNPPGWYQQTLPVNDFINDIFFVDTLNGWVVTKGDNSPIDTGYILRSTNGGNNWINQYSTARDFQVIQFVDLNTGYAGGGSGSGTRYLYKTTNGGNNWIEVVGSFGTGIIVDDINFINSDTGWYCDKNTLDGGLFQTTNGGVNWVQQLGPSFASNKIFFINSDTGWMINNHEVYQTTNSGNNWHLKYDIGFTLRDIFFVNNNTGWVTKTFINGIYKTTNGGANWTQQVDPDPTGSGLSEIFFTSPDTGYITSGFNGILKTTNGETWGFQQTPTPAYNNLCFVNKSYGWAAGGNVIVHTTDGGGSIIYTDIQQIGTQLPADFKLYQNYPNPFNPETTIEFELSKTSDFSIQIYDVSGRNIGGVGYSSKSPGRYKYIYNASGLTSGIYFYRLSANGKIVDTKKMLLIK